MFHDFCDSSMISYRNLRQSRAWNLSIWIKRAFMNDTLMSWFKRPVPSECAQIPLGKAPGNSSSYWLESLYVLKVFPACSNFNILGRMLLTHLQYFRAWEWKNASNKYGTKNETGPCQSSSFYFISEHRSLWDAVFAKRRYIEDP